MSSIKLVPFETSTNIVDYPLDFSNVIWVNNGHTPTQDATIDPFLGQNHWKLTNSVAGSKSVTQSFAEIVNTEAWTCTIWAKGGKNTDKVAAGFYSDGFVTTGGAIICGEGTLDLQQPGLYRISGLSSSAWTKLRISLASGTSLPGTPWLYVYPSGLEAQALGDYSYLSYPHITSDTVTDYLDLGREPIVGSGYITEKGLQNQKRPLKTFSLDWAEIAQEEKESFYNEVYRKRNENVFYLYDENYTLGSVGTYKVKCHDSTFTLKANDYWDIGAEFIELI